MSVLVKQVYETPDGQVFYSQEIANAHFRDDFNRWLKTNPKIPIKQLLDMADDTHADEYYCTEHDRVHAVAEQAYALAVDPRPKEDTCSG